MNTTNMHLKMTGKTIGKYTGKSVTFHSVFGKLTPGCQIVLPDDWDFKEETLFDKAERKKEK